MLELIASDDVELFVAAQGFPCHPYLGYMTSSRAVPSNWFFSQNS